MKLSPVSCTWALAAFLTGASAFGQAGSPSRDPAAMKSKDVGESVQENKIKTPEFNKANTRAVENNDPLGTTPVSAGGVPKTPKVDCPPAGSSTTPMPDCKEGATSPTTP
ncbi:MAG: hypothetical protein EOP04_28265 [Proteobacteria bacterium]|nr:MAG: hypothetical protein EOP04_28265 [Pseudomonadota bacterium]